ncbi:hypothetical protein N7499_002622 [Penicillium canescens]|uniref:NmrA-like domain-containing protein n=1 Tax=Penicillium canescens TaxID=5083 RepID=A0AAD6I9F0_PENCN|nr:uncharacterized protein N7446_010233 [Penicillium canescens]KAJ6001464.1 hypothetical protein N7522_006691 [Penicillium canescens]KAJ6035471.1 hypothetical protein N7460_009646 [Penicillium canescens]KAJ6037594.1 hypothetical protein N7444_010299 [Penicillium canescens]KAJ6054221.1 hypothetical protein N7446_010233 [Penicillium canescens]KAJ6098248.1 hypothetical protein N7499_002622 [Penicillium canescens]
MAKKIIAIVGVAGNQGASVAGLFVGKGDWHVRGLTRNPSRPASRAWGDKGVELVIADLNDVASLKPAFAGSTVIYGVTDFWGIVADSKVQERAQAQLTWPLTRLRCKHGRNIVGAANAPWTPWIGNFVNALLQVEPGKNLLGYASILSWNGFAALWGKTHGVTCRFQRLDHTVLENAVPGDIGEELADMFDYIRDLAMMVVIQALSTPKT